MATSAQKGKVGSLFLALLFILTILGNRLLCYLKSTALADSAESSTQGSSHGHLRLDKGDLAQEHRDRILRTVLEGKSNLRAGHSESGRGLSLARGVTCTPSTQHRKHPGTGGWSSSVLVLGKFHHQALALASCCRCRASARQANRKDQARLPLLGSKTNNLALCTVDQLVPILEDLPWPHVEELLAHLRAPVRLQPHEHTLIQEALKTILHVPFSS